MSIFDPHLRILCIKFFCLLTFLCALLISLAGAQGSDTPTLSTLIDQLKDNDRHQRVIAVESLGRMRDKAKAAVPSLVEALRDVEPEVRSSAALALGEIGEGSKEAIPQLVRALEDPDESVRRRSAYSLGQLSSLLTPDKDSKFSDQLNLAFAEMQSSPDSEVRQHAGEIQQAINSLNSTWWNQLRRWFLTYPFMTSGIAIYTMLLVFCLITLWLRPLWLLLINEAFVRVGDVRLNFLGNSLRLSIPHLLFIGFFRYHPRVLDAWVSKHISSARETFARLPAVEEREIYVPVPVAIDNEVESALAPDHLRQVFSLDIIQLHIVGEGGSGKTALAYQIARWAMSADKDDRLAEHIMLPVLIERDMVGRHDVDEHPLVIAIGERLRMLLDSAYPATTGLIRQLLRMRRLLVIVDGLSEMSADSRTAVFSGITELPVNAAILTSRVEERTLTARKTSIKPLRISGSMLLNFMLTYVRARGGELTDAEFYEAYGRLSQLVNDRDVTALLAKLYTEQLLAGRGDVSIGDAPANVSELMLNYLYTLYTYTGPERPPFGVVYRAAKSIAWQCLKRTFRPTTVKRSNLLSNFGEEITEDLLHYLETRLSLIRATGVDQSRIRFSLDALAEYLAAMHLVDQNGEDERAWADFLSRVNDLPRAAESAIEFLSAVRDCCLAKAHEVLGITAVAEEIERRISNASELPSNRRIEKKARFPLPIPPQEIIDACTAGECVLYGGSGLPARVGFPTWQEFLSGLIQWAVKNNYIDKHKGNSFQESLRVGRADAVSDSIYNELHKADKLTTLEDYLRDIFLRDAELPDVYSIIKLIPLAAVLTTNFDELFEKTYAGNHEQVFTPQHGEQLKSALSKYQFFILKLYGSLSQPEKVMVAPAQFEDAVSRNRTFSEFMETLFFSRTLLFIGASLEGIEAYLKGITLPQSIPRNHYALVAVEGNAWQAQADVLKRRYGIQVLPYTPSQDFIEVREFLENLASRTARKTTATQVSTQKKARLQRVVLNNIGPFDHLELDLDSKWNILLGDNGVGKSTVLKAIALAICGDDGQQYAKQLIKAGKESASIILETDRNTVYETQVYARSETAEIISKPARPLEIENWLVIGFPPLRTASWDRPKGAEAGPTIRSTPSAEDVLPLLRGGLDPRMDKLKQWIVNLDYWKNRSGSESAARYDKLIQEFFELADYLTEDLKLTYKGIDESYGIRVETNDGEIPIESVSQGTTSLTGWVGILLQRLNEVYGHEEDAKSRYALVLLDEIDAHMHPAWQQTLVHRLGEVGRQKRTPCVTLTPPFAGA